MKEIVHRSTLKSFACKSISLENVKSADDYERLVREVELMRRLDHPNIARIHEVYHSPNVIFIVMDLYTGGDLLNVTSYGGEWGVARVMSKVLAALHYCHKRGVAHRDLKLENIMYSHKGRGAEIKLVDFGLGSFGAELSDELVGSWLFMAPEVIMHKHNPKKADMWSCGVLMYCMMAGYLPFRGGTLSALKNAIVAANVDLEGRCWRQASPEARDFVTHLLCKNVNRRLSAKQACDHPWIRKYGLGEMHSDPRHEDNALEDDVVKRLRRFSRSNTMKKIALQAVARVLEPRALEVLEREFEKADISRSGEISAEDFRNILASQMAQEDVDRLFEGISVGDSDQISYSNFVAAAINRSQLDERRLRLAFDKLDVDGDGFIDSKDLQGVVGGALTQDETREAVEQFSCGDCGGSDQKNQKISFEMFFKGMRTAGASVASVSHSGFEMASGLASPSWSERSFDSDLWDKKAGPSLSAAFKKEMSALGVGLETIEEGDSSSFNSGAASSGTIANDMASSDKQQLSVEEIRTPLPIA